MRVLYCTEHKHFPAEGIADSDVWDNDAREWAFGNGNIGVIIDAEGNATNRWADGTVGVDAEAKREAETDDEPKCADHPDSFCEWRERG